MNMELYKTVSRILVINGRSHEVKVFISTCEDTDHDPFDQDFENEEHKAELQRKLSSGMLWSCGVVVKAQLAGETGTDSLWGILIGDGYTVENVISDHDMIENAMHELDTNLKFQFETLKKLFA